MATARQRRRKYERRVHHVRAQRARLRSALAELPGTFSMAELARHMQERGFEPTLRGGWRAQRPVFMGPRSAQPHMTWAGILAKRKAKKRRK